MRALALAVGALVAVAVLDAQHRARAQHGGGLAALRRAACAPQISSLLPVRASVVRAGARRGIMF